MTYTSTVTSKGTITIPAKVRQALGIIEGNTVEIALRGDIVTVTPRTDWDDFFSSTANFGEKARKAIKAGKKKVLLSNQAITEAAAEARRRE